MIADAIFDSNFFNGCALPFILGHAMATEKCFHPLEYPEEYGPCWGVP
jgi:hypothetical protein